MYYKNGEIVVMNKACEERNERQHNDQKYSILHVCQDIVGSEVLSLDQTTIKRAKDTDLDQILSICK